MSPSAVSFSTRRLLPSRSWSLRAQLVAALVVSIVLFGAAASLLTARAYRADRASAYAHLARVAGAAATEIDGQVSGIERLLTGLAGQELITSLDPARCQLVLGGAGLGPGHLVLVEPDGRLLCSSLPGLEDENNRAYAGAAWLENASPTRSVHAETVIDPLTKRLSLVVAIPVPLRAGAVGPAVLGAVLDLDGFAPDLVGLVEQARGSAVVVVDAARRTVLFRSPGRYAGTQISARRFRQSSSVFEATGLDGIRRVYRQATVPGLGWHIYAGTPVAVAFTTAHRTVSHSVLLTVVVFCVLAVLTSLLHRRLVRPTQALTAALVAAGAGPGAKPAPEDGPAELSRLAVEFNALQATRTEQMAELTETRAELQRALVRFTELQEDERRLIAQTVHDDTIQALIATMWSLEDLDQDGSGTNRDAVLDRVRANLSAAVAAARSLMFDLRPPALDELGVATAVQQQLGRLAEEAGVTVSFDSSLTGRLPVHIETLAFRTTQEAMRNIRQHAAASNVRVEIQTHGTGLDVVVEDDGVGVRPADLHGNGHPHSGIVAMRENIAMCGGRFAIGPGAHGGTLVSFTLPVEAARDEAAGPPG